MGVAKCRIAPARYGPIFRMVDMNFGEFLFHALGCISLSTLLATHSSQLATTKNIRLGDVLGVYSCYLVRARERKD